MAQFEAFENAAGTGETIFCRPHEGIMNAVRIRSDELGGLEAEREQCEKDGDDCSYRSTWQ